MDYFFRLAHPVVALTLVIGSLVIALLRFYFRKPVAYRYPLVGSLKKVSLPTQSLTKHAPLALRLSSLVLLAVLIGRPQLVDVKSNVNVEGIDIMLVLDASGSMQCFDDLKDQRSRFTVAKQEAIRFVEKRENDPIGLVIFGRDAISRCPLTLDKNILKEIIADLELGDINPDGTVLSTAIAMAANRLKTSKAKSTVMILLTDGAPTPGMDMDPKTALDLAKKLGIKIYTVGIGGDHGGLLRDQFNSIRSMGFGLNKQLLSFIAQETGGKFFLAKSPDDMKRIYDTIDTLEKTEIETNIFSKYYDLVVPFVIIIFLLLLLELFVTSTLWFIV